VTTIRGVKFTSVAIDEATGAWTIAAPTGATFQVLDGVFAVPAEPRKLRAVPRLRIPNVALSVYVPATAKRSMLITLPPGVTLDNSEDNLATGSDGPLWRLEQVSAPEAIAREV
jgi:hypothetical protein